MSRQSCLTPGVAPRAGKVDVQCALPCLPSSVEVSTVLARRVAMARQARVETETVQGAVVGSSVRARLSCEAVDAAVYHSSVQSSKV